MTKAQWTFKPFTTPLGDTGDHESCVLFTNGKDTLQTSAEELDDEQLQQFCNLLNLMPDLWSHRTDAAEFNLAQETKKAKHLANALKVISESFWTEGETDAFKVQDLKGIATEALKKHEEDIF